MKPLLCLAASCLILPTLWCQNPAADLAETLRKKVDSNPSSSQNHFDLGLVLLQQGALETAEIEFRLALRGERQSRIANWSHIYLGDIAVRNRRDVLAAEEYLAALCTDAGGAAAPKLTQLGWMESDLNQVCNPPAKPSQPSPPEVLEKNSPDYTEEARLAELEGSVVLKVAIGEDGRPYEFKVAKSLGLGLDEKAIDAVRNWRFKPAERDGRAEAGSLTVAIDFLLGPKQSRWHLIQVSLDPPAGASRPEFIRADFPRGDGILSRNGYEEGRLIGAMGRMAAATITFEVNTEGTPANIQVEQASENVWGPEAVAVVQQWKFKPAMKDGRPVPAKCAVELIWGLQEINRALASGYLLASQK